MLAILLMSFIFAQNINQSFQHITEQSFSWPVNGKIVVDFNEIYDTEEPPSDHIVIYTEDKKIYPCRDGIVIHTQWLPQLGNSIVINHGEGIYSVYAYLDKINVINSQKINKNVVIGEFNNDEKYKHLYLSLRENNIPLNPSEKIK